MKHPAHFLPVTLWYFEIIFWLKFWRRVFEHMKWLFQVLNIAVFGHMNFFFPIIVFFLWRLLSHFQYALHIKSINSDLYIDSQVTVWSHKLNSLSEISPVLSFLGHFLGFSGNVFCLPCNTSSISVNCLVKFWSTNSKLFSKATEFCPFLDKIFGHFS